MASPELWEIFYPDILLRYCIILAILNIFLFFVFCSTTQTSGSLLCLFKNVMIISKSGPLQ